MEACSVPEQMLCSRLVVREKIRRQIMRLKALRIAAVVGLALLLLLTLSIKLQLNLHAATGPYGVSETVFRWVDSSRLEVLTEDPNDFREVIALIWYPTERIQGISSPYFLNLAHVSKALMKSGEVQPWQVFGLQFIRSQNLINADFTLRQV